MGEAMWKAVTRRTAHYYSLPAQLLFVDGVYLVTGYLVALFFLDRNLHAMDVPGQTYFLFVGWAPPIHRLIEIGMLVMAALLIWSGSEHSEPRTRSLQKDIPLAILGVTALLDPDLPPFPAFMLNAVSLTSTHAALTCKRGFR